MQQKNSIKRKSAKKSGVAGVFLLLAESLFRVISKPIILAMLALFGAGFWFYWGGYYESSQAKIVHIWERFSDKAGMSLEHVYLEGQRYTSKEEILAMLDVELGDPLLSIPLAEIKENIEHLSWVKYAVIERQLPSTLSISIVERDPAALWQNEGRVHLIDKGGNIIYENNLKQFNELIIMVGKDVPLYSGQFLDMVAVDAGIKSRIDSAIRIQERRWNIRLDDGTEIKLPEDNPHEAWEYLLGMQDKKHILDGDPISIDLRVEDKMFINKLSAVKQLDKNNS